VLTLMGYFREPHSTECSRMCGMPLLFSTGVRSTTPNVLFSSLFASDITSAPDTCRAQSVVRNFPRALPSALEFQENKAVENKVVELQLRCNSRACLPSSPLHTCFLVPVHHHMRVVLRHKLLPDQLKAMQLLRRRRRCRCLHSATRYWCFAQVQPGTRQKADDFTHSSAKLN